MSQETSQDLEHGPLGAAQDCIPQLSCSLLTQHPTRQRWNPRPRPDSTRNAGHDVVERRKDTNPDANGCIRRTRNEMARLRPLRTIRARAGSKSRHDTLRCRRRNPPWKPQARVKTSHAEQSNRNWSHGLAQRLRATTRLPRRFLTRQFLRQLAPFFIVLLDDGGGIHAGILPLRINHVTTASLRKPPTTTTTPSRTKWH